MNSPGQRLLEIRLRMKHRPGLAQSRQPPPNVGPPFHGGQLTSAQAAEASARAALQIYEDLHVTPFAELIRTALANLATHPDAGAGSG